jgi:hypothetical protein
MPGSRCEPACSDCFGDLAQSCWCDAPEVPFDRTGDDWFQVKASYATQYMRMDMVWAADGAHVIAAPLSEFKFGERPVRQQNVDGL